MSTTTNKPVDTIRDGALKVTIWKNEGKKQPFYSVEPGRTYEDKAGKLQDSHSFSGSEPLRMARLLELAYTRIAELRQQDAAEATDSEAAQ